jgi:hypothetical protein
MTVVTISRFAAIEFFNALPDEQQKAVLEDSLGREVLHDGLRFAMPIWWVFLDQNREAHLRSGSAFLVDRGQGVLAVTAGHVFRGYCEAKSAAQGIVCQLGNALFHPEMNLIACNDDLDIATFSISADLLAQIDKPVVPLDQSNWAPLGPRERDFAFFAGFPAQSRGMSPPGHMLAAVPYFAMQPITSLTHRQITCRFDREKMIDFSGSGLPPQGYDIGGVSGGPMLMPTPTDQGIIWRFAGVIVEAAAGDLFEQVVSVRETFIQANGHIG